MSAGVFDLVAEALETRTDLNRLQARGTLRLSLKEAGLDPAQVNSHQMAIVITQLLPGELRSRGVEDVDALCRALRGVAASYQGDDVADAGDRIDGLFRRTL